MNSESNIDRWDIDSNIFEYEYGTPIQLQLIGIKYRKKADKNVRMIFLMKKFIRKIEKFILVTRH